MPAGGLHHREETTVAMSAETKAKRVKALEGRLQTLYASEVTLKERAAALVVEIRFAKRLLEHLKETPVLDEDPGPDGE